MVHGSPRLDGIEDWAAWSGHAETEKAIRSPSAIVTDWAHRVGATLCLEEDSLQYFGALPREWQRDLIRRCGGIGDEEIADLEFALFQPPAQTTLMKISDQISSKKKPYSSAQTKLMAAAVEDAFGHHDAIQAWFTGGPLRPLAKEIAKRTAKLAHVDSVGLHLLTANDATLLDEAKKRAEIARNRLFVHPRDRDAGSIRRRLRGTVSRAAIHTAAVLELIGGPKWMCLPAYIDNWGLRRDRDQQAANKKYLCDHVAVCISTNTKVPMTVIAASAASSRQALWYAVILGMREIARRDRLIPLFITMTLPSEWHLHPQFGEPGDPKNSPSDGAREIGNRWHKVCAMFRERGARLIGIRAAEPHSDGTVHLHCVLWLSPDHVKSMCECLGLHFPATTKEEEEARKDGNYKLGPALVVKRWEARSIDDPRGAADAASYALSYVLDAIGRPDAVIEEDETTDDDKILEEARSINKQRSDKDKSDKERSAAWARHARIRRISLVGLAPGTIGRWRALYRTMKDANNGGECVAEPRARAICHAMKRKQWGTVLRLLGALSDPSEPRLASLREKREDRWGDQVVVTTAYYHPKTGEISAYVRPRLWNIEKRDPDAPAELSVIESYPRTAPAAASRGPPGGD